MTQPAKTARQSRIGQILWLHPVAGVGHRSAQSVRLFAERRGESLRTNWVVILSLGVVQRGSGLSRSLELSLSLGLISIINVISGVAGRTAPPSFLPLSAFLVMSFVRPFLALREIGFPPPNANGRKKA